MVTGLRGASPDLEMETVAPNHWKLTHRQNAPDAAFVHLPKNLQEHQSAVSVNLKMIADFFDTKLLPQLLLDIDRSRTVTDTPLSLNSIVLFWPEGNDGIRPKGSQPKLARVIRLEDGPDGKQRKALLSYINASQIILSKDNQITNAPFKEIWRRIDQLIPVDDASHQRSVQAMLERASHSADTSSDQIPSPTPANICPDQTSSSTPSSPTHIQLSSPVVGTDDAEEIEIAFGDVDDGSATPDPSQPDDEEPDIDKDRGTDVDPNYTATILPGTTDRRVTRATRDPMIPHCSLLVQVAMHIEAQNIQI